MLWGLFWCVGMDLFVGGYLSFFFFLLFSVISVLIFWYNLFLFGRYFVLGFFLYPLDLFGIIAWFRCGLMFVLLVEALRNAFW